MKNLKKHFPHLPPNALKMVYKTRSARLKILMLNGIPADIRWLIEAKVRLSGEFSFNLSRYMPGLGKSSYAKRRRAHRRHVGYKCARETCPGQCRSLGMVSINREDKLQFIKDGLSKESLDNVLLTLETHPSGHVQGAILALWNQFQNEQERHSLGNLTVNDPVCQFIRKLDGKPIPDP